MGQTAQSLGIGPEIAFEGKVYRVAPLDAHLRARFETWLERRAFEKVRQHFGDHPTERDEQLDRTRRDVTAGVYSFGSPACTLACRTLVGLKKLLHLTIAENYPEVDEALIDRLFAEKEAEVLAAFASTDGDSKKKEPEAPP